MRQTREKIAIFGCVQKATSVVFETHFHGLGHIYTRIAQEWRCKLWLEWNVCLFGGAHPVVSHFRTNSRSHISRNCFLTVEKQKNCNRKCRQPTNERAQHHRWNVLCFSLCFSHSPHDCDSDFFSFLLCRCYYYYSRSSKTIASGNWGLSSKLCFNVFVCTFRAYGLVSVYLCECVYALYSACTHTHDISTSTFLFYEYGTADTTSTTTTTHVYGDVWDGWRGIWRYSARCERVHVKTKRLCLYDWASWRAEMNREEKAKHRQACSSHRSVDRLKWQSERKQRVTASRPNGRFDDVHVQCPFVYSCNMQCLHTFSRACILWNGHLFDELCANLTVAEDEAVKFTRADKMKKRAHKHRKKNLQKTNAFFFSPDFFFFFFLLPFPPLPFRCVGHVVMATFGHVSATYTTSGTGTIFIWPTLNCEKRMSN